MAHSSKTNPAYDKSHDDDEGDDMKGHQYYQPVTQQPLSVGRQKIFMFDAESEQKIQNLKKQHKRHKRLKASVDERQQYVARATQEKLDGLKQGLSYDEFLKGLIYGNEDNLKFLMYEKIQFKYEEEDKTVPNKKPQMPSGRMFLTNHRILFLSNEELQMLFFSGVSKPKKDNWLAKQKKDRERKKEEELAPSMLLVDSNDLSTTDFKHVYMDFKHRKPYTIDQDIKKGKYYSVMGHASDTFQYFTIPLGCVKNVELDGDLHSTDISIIKGKKPCFCCRLCGFCGCNPCTKSWKEDWNGYEVENGRVLSLGVKLPPWGHKCFVRVSIDKRQQLRDVRDFIGILQHYAPDLYTGKMEYRG